MNNRNNTPKKIILNMLLTAFALFWNGFGIHLTIRAGIGVSPWDVFNIGISKTFGILYGNASLTVAATILIIDILMREPIGLAMFIDAVVVGKSVDFFDMLNFVHTPNTLVGSILLMFVGICIIGYTQFMYMYASLGCGPRDTLLVGLARHLKQIPIGAVSIMLLATATLVGWLLGGPVGIGTIICAFTAGPIMDFEFRLMHFDAKAVQHQRLGESIKVLFGKA